MLSLYRNIMHYAGTPSLFPHIYRFDERYTGMYEHKLWIDMLFSTIVYYIKPKYHRRESTQRYFNTHSPRGKPRAFLFISKLPVRHYAWLWFPIVEVVDSWEGNLYHGSHRSWHTFFKDFSRTFEVHFQGVFKDFSLFFQTTIREKMINNGLFK